MVTTTVGMLDRVHGNTADTRPAVALGLVLVVSTTGLHDWFVDTTTASNDADHGPALRGKNLLRTGGQLNTGDALLMVVANDCGVVARGAGKGPAVASAFLDVADDCAFGKGGQWKDISDSQRSLLSTIHKLARVHAFGGQEGGNVSLVLVRIPELDLCKRGAAAGIVDNFADDAANVAVTLGVV